MKSYDIFISYRREDGAEKARTLKSELELQGFHVFLDFDELKDGVFDQRIINAIESAPIFMMILSPHALDRCVNDDDWVRREIECALANRRHFVPVDPDRSFPGFLHELPDSVKQGLGQHQFSEIMFGQLFKESVAKMVRERIRPALDVLGERNNGTPSGIGALIHIESDMDCRIFRFGKEIGLALKGEDTLIRLIRGKHKLEFVSLENDADRLTMLYPVPENDYEDILTIELLAVKAEREAVAAKAEEERLAREKAERERIEREKRLAEAQRRVEAEKQAKAERLAREREERERIARNKIAINGIFEVGDYYNDGKKQGVVFEVDATGRHGKIVSLNQSRELPWCSRDEFQRSIKTEANYINDGQQNQHIIERIEAWREKYPAFQWCADQGKGWYLPAVGELEILLLNRETCNAVNRTLDAIGEKRLFFGSGYYWASTEARFGDKYTVAKCVSCYKPSITVCYKHGNLFEVRAVSAF